MKPFKFPFPRLAKNKYLHNTEGLQWIKVVQTIHKFVNIYGIENCECSEMQEIIVQAFGIWRAMMYGRESAKVYVTYQQSMVL